MRRDEHFIVTSEPLDVAAYLSWVSDPACGATALFTGTVRSPNAGEAVHHIDYEGYEAMLGAQMRVLASE